MTEPRPASLEAVLGHRFADPGLLAAALDRGGAQRRGVPDELERLEFLGDRVLALVVAERLMDLFPAEDEGALARRLAVLVSRDSLTAVANAIGLAEHIVAGAGETEPPTADMLADVLEAVIGALYRDGGFGPASRFILATMPLSASDAVPPRDAKTALQEWLQQRGRALPRYRVVAVTGPAHAPRFTVAVEVNGEGTMTGDGTMKRAAEQAAAAAMLQRLAGAHS